MRPAGRRDPPATRASATDCLALGIMVIVLLGVSASGFGVGSTWQPAAAVRAPWCPPGQTPRFEFGFAELALHLGDIMGEPTECEHGADWTSDTLQTTTTGVAAYRWCTNTPTFTRRGEHWMLTSAGIHYWRDEGPPPPSQPVVRGLDLRRPCSA